MRALSIQKKTLGERHIQVGTTLANLSAMLTNDQDNFDPALKAGLEALAIKREVLGEEDPEVVQIKVNVATALTGLERHEEGLRMFQEVVPLQKKQLGGSHPDVAVALGGMAAALSGLGRHAQALVLLEEALEIKKAALGRHPSVGIGLMNIAVIQGVRLGQHFEAVASFEEAASVFHQTLGPSHPRTQACRYKLEQARALMFESGDAHQLGNKAFQAGSYADARRLYSRALDDTAAPAERRAKTLSNRSLLHLKAGMPAEALADAEACVAADPSFTRGAQRVDDAKAAVAVRAEADQHKERGNELFKAGDVEAALVAYDAAIAADPLHAAALNNRGLALLKLGRGHEARAALKRVVELATARGDDKLKAKAEERLASASLSKRKG